MVKSSPNILLLLTDQQSATMMSCAGNSHLRTPAMDSLAASGVRFDRAYCTNPVCVPSRFSLMTGTMPSAIGMRSNSAGHIAPVPDEIKRRGAGWVLRAAGYHTVYAGKVHLPRLTPQDLGFDVIETDERDRLADTCAQWLGDAPRRPFFLVASFINPHDICYMSIRDSQRNESERRLVTRGAVECQTVDRALLRPPGVSEEEFFRSHCPPLPANFEPQIDEPEEVRRTLEQWPFRVMARQEWSERRWREHRWAYARLTEMVDAQIGRVLQALERRGLDRETVVVFTSDHGDMDGAHRMDHKISLYEEACRVPLIIRPPGAATPAALNTTALVSNGLDLLPTLCDYAGIEPPGDLDGRSIRPIVEDGGRGTSHPWIPIENEFGRAIVTSRFKYVLYDQGSHREQLYDRCTDPGEMRNAAHAPGNHQTLGQLRETFNRQFGCEPADGDKAP